MNAGLFYYTHDELLRTYDRVKEVFAIARNFVTQAKANIQETASQISQKSEIPRGGFVRDLSRKIKLVEDTMIQDFGAKADIFDIENFIELVSTVLPIDVDEELETKKAEFKRKCAQYHQDDFQALFGRESSF